MDFDLSEEQRLLKESVEGLLGDAYDFDARKKYMKEPGGWSKAIWSRFAEQGLLGLPFAEDDGGFGAGAVETMIVMEALGRALVIEPYLATVVIGGLISSTALTLIVLPVLYRWIERHAEKRVGEARRQDTLASPGETVALSP